MVEVHNLVGNRQSDTRTADGLICLVEFFLNPRQILCGNTAACVRNDNFYNIRFILAVDNLRRDNAALWRVFKRIVKNIQENLSQSVSVAVNRGINHLGFIVKQVLALLNGALLEHIHGLVKLSEDVDFFIHQNHSAALDSAEVEQLLNDTRKPCALLNNYPHALVKGAAVKRAAFAELHGFCPALNCGKRSSQLVRYARDKVVFHLLGSLQILSHIAYRVAQITDFVVVLVLDFLRGGEVALRNLPCSFGKPLNRLDD